MVTAGVYMIGRNAVLFSHAPADAEIVGVIGRRRRSWPARSGSLQNDIKRVLAYSTVSSSGTCSSRWRRRVCGRHLSPLYTRLLQGAALPCSGAVNSRAGGRTGSPADGRLRRICRSLTGRSSSAAIAIAGGPGWPASSAGRDSVRTYPAAHRAVDRRHADVAVTRSTCSGWCSGISWRAAFATG